MQHLHRAVLALMLVTVACGGESTPPPVPGSSPSAPLAIAGTEKLGWDQAAPDLGQASQYQYSAYVDGSPFDLPDAVCQSSGTGSFSCVARLPQMTAGAHAIEISANVFGVEGPRSVPLYVTVAVSKGAAAARAVTSVSTLVATSDGTLKVETIASNLDAPSSLAATPDGRIFIAQGSGAINVWQNGQVQPGPAVTLTDAQRVPGTGLVGMALDREFATNGRVYVAYVGTTRKGEPVNRVIRFRELNNVFAEPVVILEDPITSIAPRSPRIRVGPDRKLYVALPAGEWSTADSFASYAGKMLRINDDGTTPRDNPRLSPILSDGHMALGGLDWQQRGDAMWFAERDRQNRDVLSRLPAASSNPVSIVLDSQSEPMGLAFFPADPQTPFSNDLFIGTSSGQELRRVRFDARGQIRIQWQESLLKAQFGRFSDVIAGPDGALYVSTSNRGTDTAGRDDDRILRVSAVKR